MKIIVFGLPKEVPDDATVSEVLRVLDEPVKHVLVEINGRYVRQQEYDETRLQEGDRLEVIYPAFGG